MKRPLVKISVLLVIAAAINVATAWACALVADISAAPVRELYTPLGSSHHWEVFRWDSGPGTRILSQCWNGPAPVPHNPGRPEALLPQWAGIDPPDPNAPEVISQIEEAWGYPMRTLSGTFVSKPTAQGASNTRSGVICVRRAEREGERGLCLPLSPIWTGFAVNTAVHALLVLVVYAAVRDLRRLARSRRRVHVPA